MDRWLTLGISLVLFLLWVISLASAAAQAWFQWLVFVAAVVLFVVSVTDIGAHRREVSGGHV